MIKCLNDFVLDEYKSLEKGCLVERGLIGIISLSGILGKNTFLINNNDVDLLRKRELYALLFDLKNVELIKDSTVFASLVYVWNSIGNDSLDYGVISPIKTENKQVANTIELYEQYLGDVYYSLKEVFHRYNISIPALDIVHSDIS